MKRLICVFLVVFFCLSVSLVGCTPKYKKPLQDYSENSENASTTIYSEKTTEETVPADVNNPTTEAVENATTLLPKEISVEEQSSLPGKRTSCLGEYDQFPITVTYADGVEPFLTYDDLNTLVWFTEADAQIWGNNASPNYNTSPLPFEGEMSVEDIIADNERRNEHTENLGLQIISIYCESVDQADVYYLTVDKGTLRGIENHEFLVLNHIAWQKENGMWKYVSGGINYVGDRYDWYVDIQPESGYVEVHAHKESY